MENERFGIKEKDKEMSDEIPGRRWGGMKSRIQMSQLAWKAEEAAFFSGLGE